MTTIATATLPKNVQYPQYDRGQLRSRIVHFGFGAFHRAHQALLTDRVLNNVGGDWGICEISLFSGDTLMSQLREQDHLFTVLEKGADGNQPIVIGAVHECLNARLDSLAAIIEKFLRAAGSDCLADHYGKRLLHRSGDRETGSDASAHYSRSGESDAAAVSSRYFS